MNPPPTQTPGTSLSNDSSLSIGQVIYILSHKAQTVVPAVVIEEIIVKKINGNQTSWKVSIGPKDKNRVVDSTKIDGEIFTSLDEVRNILMERWQQYVNNLTIETERRVENWYGRQASSGMVSFDNSGQGSNGKIDPESLINSIEGPSSQMASNPSSAGKMNLPPPTAQTGGRADLRDKLRSRIDAEDDEESSNGQPKDDPDVIKQVVSMPGPDGKNMLVSVKVPLI
jgi:hypothetical protein